jgi:hypothetical protein
VNEEREREREREKVEMQITRNIRVFTAATTAPRTVPFLSSPPSFSPKWRKEFSLFLLFIIIII